MSEEYAVWLVYTRLDRFTIAAAAVVEKGEKSALLADKIQIESEDVDDFAIASVSWIKNKLAGKGSIKINVQSEVIAMACSDVNLSRTVADFDRYVKAYWAFSNFGKNEHAPRRRRRRHEAAESNAAEVDSSVADTDTEAA